MQLPSSDRRLAWDDEHISLAEALHEELYFSTLEYFQQRAGLALGDHSIQPGQIVPEVSTQGDEAYLQVSLRPLDVSQPQRAEVTLGTAQQAIGVTQIEQLLAAVDGQALRSTTRAGRSVDARYRVGSDRAVMISAGQHANEISGVVSALRAAQTLSRQPEAHFVISPLENHLISEDADPLTPLMLITEYPDETLSGDAFIQAHTAQMATVVAAYNAFQTLALAS